MTETPRSSEKLPPLYETRSVPFEKLSAGDFEKCVFACFLTIESYLRLRINGQPAGSGDGGFDVYGVAEDTNRKVCIQCKRQKASLGLPLLAKEVAKVALTTHLEKSDVGEHFFICTGGVTGELRRQLRETGRIDILNAAQEKIRQTKEGELYALRERVNEAGEDAEVVIGTYVQMLDRLVAWDIDEFDNALSPAWDSVLIILERYFKVSTVIREHPRALFDRKNYQDWSRSFTEVVEPQLEEGELPAGIVDSSAADLKPQELPAKKQLLTIESLATLEPGDVALVVAEGGAGKTTLLELIRAEVATKQSNSTLSVLITCAEYQPGALDTAIHAQLGVKSGNWRMLPDKIQILCDGINEASTEVVKALFGELKPLLRSKHISCIFTSREDSRMVRTVLPSIPCASLRLVPLTPSRVRAIAQHELIKEAEVIAFVDAHRAMAARATASFMWTPFAVRIALKLWKASDQLGDTLGDLLDAVVSARADRDLEISTQDSLSDLPRVSVLAIASAMAFEMLLVDGSAACSACEIGSTYKRAMRLCSNVYGADGLNSSKLIGLLRKHDLVQQTPDESFQWNHQLVAGALAAKHLSSQWREHLHTLQQPLSDDAWVFAIRYLPESDLDEYLGELFYADLMLGARATAELQLNERDRSLQYIFKTLEVGQPEDLGITGFFALAKVGTEKALSFLQQTAKNRKSDIGFVAARALAYSGDRTFLFKLLEEVDERRRIGWNTSGGDISIWETASLADRIAIARERLISVAPGEPVNESLNLVSYETSREDIPLFENHLHASKDITAWSTALRAISNCDHNRAQTLLEETLSKEIDSKAKATIMTVGHRLGLFIDVKAAFSLLMDLSTSGSNDQNIMIARHDLTDILGELQFPTTLRSQIKAQLATCTGEKKYSLWQLATHIESPTLAIIALDIFDKEPENAGMAANFFLAHKSLRDEHHDSLQTKIGLYLKKKANWFTFNCWRILTLQTKLGFTLEASELLQKMILRLTELRELVEDGIMPTFDEAETHIAKDFTLDHAKYRLEHYVGYLASGAVGAKKILPSHILLKFLHFDLANVSPGKEIVEAYSEIAPDLLDDELEKVRDRWAQRAVLEMVCEFGLTEKRLELLRIHLKEVYCHPAALSTIKNALEKCWTPSTCKMVVETIADFEDWPEEYQQFFWHFVDMVTARLTSDDRSLVERHTAIAKTTFAQRILRIWHQATLDSRVGLSRLEEK
ncbi:restriction endonuclease [Methylophaga thalassica]|uniref:restriction endonuclease n=1 Tax=Methylophaga thalassica TaxID=40223 RepID=UPI002E7BA3E0|nr:restriction endonuclease [Methylophaga thalassica]WVI83636.1 restriction endonuclease [Methylophaga thalassica]